MKVMSRFKRFSMKPSVGDTDVRSFTIGEWNYNKEKEILQCSEEVYTILGVPDSVQGNSSNIFVQSVLEKDREVLTECWDMIFRGEMVGSLIFRTLYMGKRRLIYCSINNVFNPATGELTSVSGIIRDITDLFPEQMDLFEADGRALNGWPYHQMATIDIDRHLKTVRVSEKAVELFGWSEAELLLKAPQHIPTRYGNIKNRILKVILHSGGSVRLDTVRVKKGGEPFNVGVILAPVYSETGKIVGVRGIYTDVVEEDDGKRLLYEIEQQIMAIAQNSTDACVILSSNMKMKYVTPAIRNVLGFSPEEFARIDPKLHIHPQDIGPLTALIKDLTSDPLKTRGLDLRVKHKNGEWRNCSARIRYLSGHYGINGVIVNFHDTTEIKQNQQLMQYMSFFDLLTDLPNHRLFHERLSTTLGMQKQRGGKLALIRLDINRLDYINDTLGRAAGDELLQLIAETLRGCIPKEYTLSRIGDYAFAIMAPDVRSADDAVTLARMLTDIFENPIHLNQRELYPNCNIGIAMFPDDGTDADRLIKNADVALLQSREERGQNALYLYSAKSDARAYKAFSLANDFRRALKNSEFVVYYQPQVETSSGEILGAEALIRWEHDEWGLISPMEFLHIAEETSLIVTLGEWILRQVCARIADWSQRGFTSIYVSVNFSVKQLLDKDVVATVQRALADYDVPPYQLEIEITETSILPNDPRITNAIKELRSMGIRVYFDDFGTGYSSLSWLYQFELDGIKLDKTFISHVPTQPVPSEIVESVIKLAHSLGLGVVAEGVEYKHQLQFLNRLGCERIQGFLYSRPVSANQFEHFLRDGLPTLADKENESTESQNRRRYFRLYFEKPLVGEFTVTRLKHKPVTIGSSKILVVDMGPGGLRFISDLQLPPKNDLIFQFWAQLMGETLDLTGEIVWKQEYGEQLYQYGVEFKIDEIQRERLVRFFHEVSLRMNNGTIDYQRNEFYQKSLYLFFDENQPQ